MSIIGKQIDRYRILEQLGKGGMAVVYKAYDTRLEREVAFKMIRTENIPPIQLGRLLQRFEREAKAQAKFNHPNIVSVFDYGEYNGSPYLVMSLESGDTLKSLTGRPMAFSDAIEVLLPIIDALRYAHEQGIIHRDVKPSNILIGERPMLTDFGIAKILEAGEETLTGTGLGVGTPEYMAPEQWKGKPVLQTDVYAIGVILYELITGQKPYSAETPAAIIIKQATDPLKRPIDFIPNLPDSVEKVLFKTLAINPEDRYKTMGELKEALEKVKGKKATVQKPLITNVASVETNENAQTFDSLETQTNANKKQMNKKLIIFSGGFVFLIMLGFGFSKTLKKNDLAVIDSTDTPVFTQTNISMDTITASPTAKLISTEAKTLTFTPTIVITPTLTETLIMTSTTTSSSVLGIGSTIIREKDGMEMVYVPEGEFIMGSIYNSYVPIYIFSRDPNHKIYLEDFFIDKYEVNNGQYAEFLNKNGNQIESDSYWFDSINGENKIIFENGEWKALDEYYNHPVAEINWYGAQSYCEWVGGKLPTEAQWEKAARGNDGRVFPWGNNIDSNYLNYKYSYIGDTTQVGNYPLGKSYYGAMDMAGNVWEWVDDWFESDYYKNSPYENPLGPITGDKKGVRGGSWNNIEMLVLSTGRYSFIPNTSTKFIGFRCAFSE